MYAQRAMSSALSFRKPSANDGSALHSLIQQCPPLDSNSMYCNLLQCTSFSETSAVAVLNGELVAAVTGFLDPTKQGTLFIWQIAVREDVRGQGLSQALIEDILNRRTCAHICHIETSITESNEKSRAVFKKLARALVAPISHQTLFDQARHFAGQHPTEMLVRIGPFALQQ